MSATTGLGLRVAGIMQTLGGRPVLGGVDLEARAGEIVAVVGKSGCGKTTLLRLIAGLDRPAAGTLALDGCPAPAAHPRVRMVFQDARLLPWRRVIDNVALGLPRDARHRQAARDALARVGLAGRADDWPGVLSGGERQRVALARALASRPGLLLLDEPLGALDALTRLEMQRLLEDIWREAGFTAVLVTHDVHEAVALADRVVVLDGGRVATSRTIALPRPRDRASAAFTGHVSAILGRIFDGAAAPASDFVLHTRRMSFM
jgi:sulfonate transport system ATP-binding protein